jgi:hypothetical protein
LKLVVGIVLFLAFFMTAQTIRALPAYQFPCFSGEGCPELLNPESDEYYSIQCTTNAIWVWRSVPAPSIVTFISFFQVAPLSDGSSFTAPGNVTLTRSGDTITLSGDNGNLAPQPGAKSVSWNECVERNGGLPELPPIAQELSDEQIACMNLTTEQETVDCLAALEAETDISNTQDCEDELYAQTHAQECFFVSCPLDSSIRVADLSECPDQLALLYEEINAILEFCLGPPVTLGAVFVPVAVFRRRRRRK